MNRRRETCLAVLVLLTAFASFTVNVWAAGLTVNVHARAVDADGDFSRNDIAVSGNIIVSGVEGAINVGILLEVVGPDGGRAEEYLTLGCEAEENGNTLLKYGAVFKDFVSVKGMYCVTVTATLGDVTASRSFVFDPPGGSLGPLR